MEGLYMICITSGSGLPVFTRSVGNVKQLPFPVIGSLNAVHMFAANHGTELRSTATENAKIVWKVYHESLLLVAVKCENIKTTDAGLEHLLDLVWYSMVLLYGQEELKHIRNVERFKKEIKVCHPLIDTLLNQDELPVFSDMSEAVEGLLAVEATSLQNFLDAFTEAAGSPYGCLMVHGRVVVATSKWWDLTALELVLLSLLTRSFSPCSSRDVPIYLPHLSPNVPHRLLTFRLMSHVEVWAICGPTPSLKDLEQEVGRFWVPSVDTLRAVRQNHPGNFPSHIDIDSNILGLILINTVNHQSISSVNIHKDIKDSEKLRQRREILRTFYNTVKESYFNNTIAEDNLDLTEASHSVSDTYIVYTSHKCYALTSDGYQIFVLFSSKVPTYALRNICYKTLTAFTKDKSVVI